MTETKKKTTGSGQKSTAKKPAAKPTLSGTTQASESVKAETPKPEAAPKPEQNPYKEIPKEKAHTTTVTSAEKKTSPTVSSFPFNPVEVPKLVLLDTEKLPKGMEVNRKGQAVHIYFDGTILNELNVCNHYTQELRNAFHKASMYGWKAIFYVNGKRYISTLNKVSYNG